MTAFNIRTLVKIGAVVGGVLLAAACSSGTQGDSGTSPSTTSTSTSPSTAVAACWETVAAEYQDASDQASLILRDGIARLAAAQRRFARALKGGDIAAARSELGRVIDEARSVTEASIDFDRVGREAAGDESQCEADGSSGVAGVDACWEDVARAYADAANRANQALHKPMAKVLFGIQEVLAAGNEGDIDGVYRGDRILAKALADVDRAANRFNRAAGAAADERTDCAGS